MGAEPAPPVDSRAFLAGIGAAKTRTELRRRQIVFSQGYPADTWGVGYPAFDADLPLAGC